MHLGDRRKKLREAARYWIDQPSAAGDDDLKADAEFFGIDLGLVKQHEETPFPLLAGNVPIVEAFLAVQTQLTRAGFRYEGVESGLRMCGIDRSPAIFRGLQIMESALLEYLTESRDV